MQQATTKHPLQSFNLTIEEVRILVKFRALSRHQQKGILQAIELIRPTKAYGTNAPAHTR